MLLVLVQAISATFMRTTKSFAPFPTYPVSLTFKGAAPDVVSFPSPAMAKSTAFPLHHEVPFSMANDI
eukprot:TRINITY_DN16063_c0_g1_i1.p1 TRINITY_DN16063_c0_g1~~TRINITY_DN16063_c0_g1_i1.p1  ORF type:complete len:68 (+),score=2.19 TRINITY_DN16063_c0_g1_i1:239-442(+)